MISYSYINDALRIFDIAECDYYNVREAEGESVNNSVTAGNYFHVDIISHGF